MNKKQMYGFKIAPSGVTKIHFEQIERNWIYYRWVEEIHPFSIITKFILVFKEGQDEPVAFISPVSGWDEYDEYNPAPPIRESCTWIKTPTHEFQCAFLADDPFRVDSETGSILPSGFYADGIYLATKEQAEAVAKEHGYASWMNAHESSPEDYYWTEWYEG